MKIEEINIKKNIFIIFLKITNSNIRSNIYLYIYIRLFYNPMMIRFQCIPKYIKKSTSVCERTSRWPTCARLV